MLSDERHFFVQGNHGRFVRIKKGEQLSPAHFKEVVKHLKKMFLDNSKLSRVGSLVVSKGMMCLDKYIDFNWKKVIPDMRRAFPDGERIFQTDLARVRIFV